MPFKIQRSNIIINLTRFRDALMVPGFDHKSEKVLNSGRGYAIFKSSASIVSDDFFFFFYRLLEFLGALLFTFGDKHCNELT